MNFLNKIKEQVNNTGSSTPIPGGKPPIPGGRPPILGARPGVPPISGGRPPVPGVKATPVSTSTIVETKGPIESKGNPFIINKKEIADVIETPVKVAPIAEVTESIKKEEGKEVVSNITNEPTVIEPINLEEEIKAKTKSKGKGRAKKTEAKETTSDVRVEEECCNEVIIPKTEGTYAEVVLAIKSTFADTEWDEFKEDTTKRLGEIQIASDMTPAALKHTISDLNALRDSVWNHFLECKTFFETLTAKDDGLLDRVKRLNSKGTNDNERKVNATLALMNYKQDGKLINLYEVLDASRVRFNYTKGLMESIQYKSNAVITMLGNLKLEK